MIGLITSTPNVEGGHVLDAANGLVERLRECIKPWARHLMIAASPGEHALNDEMTDYFEKTTRNTGFEIGCFDLWDDRCAPKSREEMAEYDVIWLAGGHVPTQRRWFEAIGLRERLEGYGGVIISISAGSMNAAQTVYAWPEMPGEANDPEYELFFDGLGLCGLQVLPHFQRTSGMMVDGMTMEQIAVKHSGGHCFYGLPDGSYVHVQNGIHTLYGPAVRIADGKTETIYREGGLRLL